MDKESILPVAVLGAGIAGVQAAIDLSRLNYKVVLIERADRPGGKLAVLPKTFPTNDCSACALTPQDGFFCIRSPYFLRLAGEDRIVLLTGAEVKKSAASPAIIIFTFPGMGGRKSSKLQPSSFARVMRNICLRF